MAEKTKKTVAKLPDDLSWPFGKKNYLFFGLALVVIAAGYILLGQGSITAAPILLVLGYCVLVPVALVVRDGKSDTEPKQPEN